MQTWRNIVDATLEASVVGSFTRIGPAVRRRVHRWEDAEPRGARRVLVTGGTSGIGFATVAGLLRRGAQVTLTARDAGRGDAARTALLKAARPGTRSGDVSSRSEEIASRLDVEILDLDSLASVRALAHRLEQSEPHDVIVHNAGAMIPERMLTVDGLERTWQIHVVAPFLLTAMLQPQLSSRPDPRVIWVSSGGMYTERLVVRRVDSPGRYRPSVAYARAKRAQVELVRELHARVGEHTGIAFHAMHPGWVRTPGLAMSLPTFHRLLAPLLRTPEQGADTIVHLALSERSEEPADPLRGGLFWADRRPRAFDRLSRTVCDSDERDELWQRCLLDAGLSPGSDPV